MSRRQPSRRVTSRSGPEPAPTRLRVSDPTDLLAVIPYLLSFHPSESVVAVLVRSGRVLLTARIDLPPAEDAGPLADAVTELAAQHGAAELVLVAYSSDPESARPVLARLTAELEGGARFRLTDAIVVGPDRWWSLRCARACCPPEGRPYEIGSNRLAAEAVYAGMSVHPSRTELEALVNGPDASDWPRLLAAGQATLADLTELAGEQEVELMESTVRSVVAGELVVDEAVALRLALLATDLRLRDLAWAAMTREAVHQHIQLWTDVVAAVPPVLASAPLALLGMAAWIGGHGALLNCCVARLEEVDPDYSMGHLLADISARAVPPTVWDELKVGLQEELGLMAG